MVPTLEAVIDMAKTVYGKDANQWLDQPNLALTGGVAPRELMASTRGLCEVMRMLTAIAYGGVV